MLQQVVIDAIASTALADSVGPPLSTYAVPDSYMRPVAAEKTKPVHHCGFSSSIAFCMCFMTR